MLSIYVVTVLLSCNQGQQINIIGYAYRGEKVIVKDKEKVVLTIRADSLCDEKGVCYFNESMGVMPRTQKIRVLIDSFNKKVLDTVLDTSRISKADVISILYPKVEEGKKRGVFIVNTKDSLYKQY